MAMRRGDYYLPLTFKKEQMKKKQLQKHFLEQPQKNPEPLIDLWSLLSQQFKKDCFEKLRGIYPFPHGSTREIDFCRFLQEIPYFFPLVRVQHRGEIGVFYFCYQLNHKSADQYLEHHRDSWSLLLAQSFLQSMQLFHQQSLGSMKSLLVQEQLFDPLFFQDYYDHHQFIEVRYSFSPQHIFQSFVLWIPKRMTIRKQIDTK
jgi:hypothetical protein